MSFYENVDCPVCKRSFEAGDDIVTCPECGTPHHRECYDLIGRCVNAGLHKANYDFYAENIKPAIDVKKDQGSVQVYYSPAGATDNQSKETADNSNQQSAQNYYNIPVVDISFEEDADTIDGESVADFAAVIRTNAIGFIKKFKRLDKSKKSISWNWGAFFFGSLYMFFRKMYKEGLAFFSLFLTAVYGCSALLYKYASSFIEGMNDIVAIVSSGTKTVTEEQMNALMSTKDYATATKITYIFFAVILLLRIIEALFADRMYKNTVTAIIKRVKQQLEQGASFMQTSMFGEDQPNLSQVQMKRLYLSRRGGVSFFAPLIALMVIRLFLFL